jgi:hypothetical protein
MLDKTLEKLIWEKVKIGWIDQFHDYYSMLLNASDRNFCKDKEILELSKKLKSEIIKKCADLNKNSDNDAGQNYSLNNNDAGQNYGWTNDNDINQRISAGKTDLAKKNKEKKRTVSRNEMEEILKLIKTILLFESRINFDSYCQYIEYKRDAEKQFYFPRRKVLKSIADDMNSLVDGNLELLSISMPPGTGKSTLGIFLLSWVMGKNPNAPNLVSAHSGTLTRSFYDGALKIISDPEYLWKDVFPNNIRIITNAKDETIDLNETRRFSTLTCRAINASLTGAARCEGILYCDDLCSGIEEALNRERMESLWTKYTNDLKSRKKMGAKELHIATRWTVHDVIGKLEIECAAEDVNNGERYESLEKRNYENLEKRESEENKENYKNLEKENYENLEKRRSEKNKENENSKNFKENENSQKYKFINDKKNFQKYKFISIPALNENGESNFNYDFGVGFNRKYFLDMKHQLDDASFSALYMNEPFEREGILFREPELRRYFELPQDEPDSVISVCDCKDIGGDYLFLPIAYVYGSDYYIEDCVCNNGDLGILDGIVTSVLNKHKVKACRFESNASGARFAEKIQSMIRDSGGNTHITTKHSGNQQKATRIITDAPWVREHCLFREGRVREHCLFREGWVREHCLFREGNGIGRTNESYERSRIDQGTDYFRMMKFLCSWTQTGRNKYDDVVDGMSQLARFAQSLSGSVVQVFARPF